MLTVSYSAIWGDNTEGRKKKKKTNTLAINEIQIQYLCINYQKQRFSEFPSWHSG